MPRDDHFLCLSNCTGSRAYYVAGSPHTYLELPCTQSRGDRVCCIQQLPMKASLKLSEPAESTSWNDNWACTVTRSLVPPIFRPQTTIVQAAFSMALPFSVYLDSILSSLQSLSLTQGEHEDRYLTQLRYFQYLTFMKVQAAGGTRV